MPQVGSIRSSSTPSPVPLLVLCASLVMTLTAVGYLLWVSQARDRLRFQNRIQKTVGAVDQRLDTYLALLRAGRGLFATGETVKGREFRKFVESLNLKDRYPGIQGIGFAKRVAHEDVEAFIESARAEGFPDFKVWGDRSGPDRIIIRYLEPLDRRNQVALGFDIGGEPSRRRALDRARDDGVAASSGRVTLVQEIDAHKQAGFLVYAPLYRPGMPVATVEQRRAAIEGFVFSPFRGDDLLGGLLDPDAADEIAVRFFVGAERSESNLLHRTTSVDPDPTGWTEVRTLQVAGQPWTLEFRTLPDFGLNSATDEILFFLVVGLVVSGVLYRISRGQARARWAAERLAADHVKSERAFQRSEERLRRVVETALDAIITIDLEGRITGWNPTAEELFGWPSVEVMGKGLAETIIPPAYREAHLRGLELYRTKGEGPILNRRIEITALCRDGTEIPVELTVTAIGSGAQTTFSAFLRDLRVRRQAETSLKESYERFRIAAGTTTDLIYEWHLDSGGIEWFGDVDRQLGLPTGQAPRTRKGWEEIIHPEDSGRVTKAVQAQLAGGTGFYEEYRVRRQDGTWRVWTDRSVAVRDAEGKAVKWIGAITDVTDRRRLEREREKLLEQLQLQMERMPVACILTDPDFRIRLWNPAAAHVFGFSREEAAGRTLEDLIVAPEARDEAMTHFRGMAQRDVPSITTWQNIRRDGHKILCEWHAGPLFGADGAFAGIQAMAIDTTERATLEGQLRQAQKMEAIGRLAGGIAHDFNNLLTAVSGYSELLLDSVRPGDPVRGHLEEIRKAAVRAADLTRQLLAFSRKQVLEPTLLDLNAVLSDMDKMLRRVIGEDVNLVAVFDPSLGRVKADRGQIEQVIMNLAVNARDAMPRGGRLTLETRNIDLDASYARNQPEVTPGPHVLLAVSDNGAGIPAEVLPRIFEPFFTTKERGKGTGLGLSTVYGIVKQSGGHVAAYSEPGHGATFKIYLPRVDQPVEPAAPARPAERIPTVGGSETILIVEDEAPVRKLLTQVLKQHGYTLLEAANGLDALDVASRHDDAIHLMVTDVVMPGMSGRDLAHRIESARPDMKVLYISGYTENAIVHHGELDPGTAFLAKPFTPAALAQKVREVLG